MSETLKFEKPITHNIPVQAEVSVPKAIAVAIGGGKRHNETVTDASKRGWTRVGAAIAGLGLVGGLTYVAHKGLERSQSSPIPATAEHNPAESHYETIPGDMTPWEFVDQNDGNHDPRAGLGNLKQQNGRAPQPGDTVLVPNDPDKK